MMLASLLVCGSEKKLEKREAKRNKNARVRIDLIDGGSNRELHDSCYYRLIVNGVKNDGNS